MSIVNSVLNHCLNMEFTLCHRQLLYMSVFDDCDIVYSKSSVLIAVDKTSNNRPDMVFSDVHSALMV